MQAIGEWDQAVVRTGKAAYKRVMASEKVV